MLDDTPLKLLRIAVDVPLPGLFDYRVPSGFTGELTSLIGLRVIVPWGSVERPGIVFEVGTNSLFDTDKIREVRQLLDELPALPMYWLTLIQFAAQYYHCGVGELALPVLPKLLRAAPTKRTKSIAQRKSKDLNNIGVGAIQASVKPDLTDQQAKVLERLISIQGYRCVLLHGITGSGKTEVYLRWFDHILAQNTAAQVLLLVPEIGLTPQLLGAVQRRFPNQQTAVLHSSLSDAQRTKAWLSVVDGSARIIVGTRLSALTPMPNLAAVVVDEEHDSSYRQTEGVHYSARDLAIVAAQQRNVPIVLGSATPSLESWQAAQRGRYAYSSLPERATGAALPDVSIIGIRHAALVSGLCALVLSAIKDTLDKGLQVLIYINRRGFSPVMSCSACGWLSACEACSANRVLHRQGPHSGSRGWRLICHHCTSERPVPKHCPDCGNVDIGALGRGTQRIEEELANLFPQCRIGRVDRDVSKKAGAAQAIIAAAHDGTIDLLIGTQILAKGHDFQRLALVVAVDADQGLFSSDFRAPERLFANLMQVAGRAGRANNKDLPDGVQATKARVLIQTRYPEHAVFTHLQRHDYEQFAKQQLRERDDAALPPFVFHALFKAQGRDGAAVLEFLNRVREQISADILEVPAYAAVRIYHPVPMPMAKIANLERAQLLVESGSRKQLHQLINQCLPVLRSFKTSARWQLEIDPLEI